jgi:hypothetical protein
LCGNLFSTELGYLPAQQGQLFGHSQPIHCTRSGLRLGVGASPSG